MDFSELSHFATMQVKLCVPGFLLVANPNNSVKNWKKTSFYFLHEKTFYLQKRFYMIHSRFRMGVTVP